MSIECYSTNCNPLSRIKSDSDLLDMADEIAEKVQGCTAESSRLLFIACVAFLRDYFPKSDFSICGVETLLSLALKQEKYDTNVNFHFRKTPLDLLFLELETGKHFECNNGSISTKKSTFFRICDGVRPADIGGLKPGTDTALTFYRMWQHSGTPQTLEQSIYDCIGAVAGLGLQ